MGMFDTIVMAGPKDALRCAHGHEMRELQTKDLECEMLTYYVWDGLLYRGMKRERSEMRYELRGDALVATHETRAVPATASGEVVVYADCEACLPVLVESVHSSWHGYVDERYPWVQYVLRFEGSRLWERRPDRVETRHDVREKHPGAIPDDDRVARRHFERKHAAT